MKKVLLTAIMALTTSCATPINSGQREELKTWEAKGFKVEEKSKSAAATLGILPGGGSFYTRNYGLGVVNLMFWPLSITWDPISGENGAESINYYATKLKIEMLKNKEIEDLEDKLALGDIDRETYTRMSIRIKNKYSGM